MYVYLMHMKVVIVVTMMSRRMLLKIKKLILNYYLFDQKIMETAVNIKRSEVLL